MKFLYNPQTLLHMLQLQSMFVNICLKTRVQTPNKEHRHTSSDIQEGHISEYFMSKNNFTVRLGL